MRLYPQNPLCVVTDITEMSSSVTLTKKMNRMKNYKRRNLMNSFHSIEAIVPVRFQTILMSESANLYSPFHIYILTDKRKDTQNICQLIHELT